MLDALVESKVPVNPVQFNCCATFVAESINNVLAPAFAVQYAVSDVVGAVVTVAPWSVVLHVPVASDHDPVPPDACKYLFAVLIHLIFKSDYTFFNIATNRCCCPTNIISRVYATVSKRCLICI